MEALTLNQRFEKNRIHNTISSIYPFSVLTVGAIYKITQTRYDFNEEDKCMDTYKGKACIITIVKEGDEDCTKFQVWAPIRLLHDLDTYPSPNIMYIRPTGLHTNINTKKQYYTYEFSIGDIEIY